MSQLEDYDPAAEYMDLQELAAELSRTQLNSAELSELPATPDPAPPAPNPPPSPVRAPPPLNKKRQKMKEERKGWEIENVNS